MTFALASGLSSTLLLIGVSTAPGATLSTLIPSGASSLAIDCVNIFMPPLEAQ
jgi:hypothetical protein